MKKTLFEVFDEHFSHVKFDLTLATKLYQYQVRFVNKNREHMEFFGGKIFGVQAIRFSNKELSELFDHILDVDEGSLKYAIKHTNYFNKDFVLTGSSFYLTMIYLMHRFYQSPDIPKDFDRSKILINIALIMNYRLLTKALIDIFQYTADPKIAEATYAALSNRYLIKRLNNWQEVFIFRSTEMTAPHSIHYKNITMFNDEAGIAYAISDARNRIYDIVKNIYDEYLKVKRSGLNINTVKSVGLTPDGKEELTDVVRSNDTYITYIESIITDEHSFVKPELISIVDNLLTSLPVKLFTDLLVWVSRHYQDPNTGYVSDLVNKAMVYNITYTTFNTQYPFAPKHIDVIMQRLKGTYISGRGSDSDLEFLRKEGIKLVKDALHKNTETIISSCRTGLYLYLALRALAKDLYKH